MVPLAVLQVFFLEKFGVVKPAFMNVPCLLNKRITLRLSVSSRPDSRVVLKRNTGALL